MCGEIENMLLESSHETAVKIAMRMLSSGKLTLEEIAYFTGLPIHEQSPICPSALPDVNVPQLLEQIIEEKAYKNDYDNFTT